VGGRSFHDLGEQTGAEAEHPGIGGKYSIIDGGGAGPGYEFIRCRSRELRRRKTHASSLREMLATKRPTSFLRFHVSLILEGDGIANPSDFREKLKGHFEGRLWLQCSNCHIATHLQYVRCPVLKKLTIRGVGASSTRCSLISLCLTPLRCW
jgi:hypothetical protein